MKPCVWLCNFTQIFPDFFPNIFCITQNLNSSFVRTSINTNKKYGYNYDIKLNAHSIYNDESYDIKRWSGFGNINKKLYFQNLLLDADANVGLDLYSIQGRPSNDTNDNRYIDRISSGLSIAASNQFDFINENSSFIIEPKIQLSSLLTTDRTDEVPNRDSS